MHTDSAFVAQELIEMLGAPAERVRTVHLGVPPVHAGARLRSALPEWATSYILAIGTVEPRKDLPTLVRAFGQVAPGRPGLALVIAGSEGWGGTELDEAVAACPAREPGAAAGVGGR